MDKILRVENICKEGILDNVSFEMCPGEMLAIMGPSGSGKSTLLYNISGMDQPEGGSVWLEDKEVTALDEDAKADMRLHDIGFVFQQMNMLPDLNIMENILLPGLQAHGKKAKAELTARASELMEKLSISELGDRKISEVSGGQLQRACICRSMINRPGIIFADEPTGALNKSASDEVMDALTALNRDGSTVLMVTHDSKMASRCSRILYLSDGQILGELRPATDNPEREVQQWLADMGW